MLKQRLPLFFIFIIIALWLSGCRHQTTNNYQGYIEGKYTYVSSEVGGILERLDIEKGQTIQAKHPLFQLNVNPQITQLHQAKADLQQAKSDLLNLQKGKRPSEISAINAQKKQIIAQLNYADATVIRYKKLTQNHFISKEKLDEALSNQKNLQAKLKEINENIITAKLFARQDEIDAAKAKVKAAQSALEKALWDVQQKVISSPVSGFVFDTYYRMGEMVQPNSPVLSILAPENIHALFYIPETKLSQVKIGEAITLYCDGMKQPIKSTINYISPEAEYTPPVIYSEKTRPKLVYEIEAKFAKEEAQKLHPGQPITVFLNENS